MDAEAVRELGAVSLHGLEGDVEAARDFLVRMTFGDELQHLSLPGCEHRVRTRAPHVRRDRSEEHTSELQSLTNLVCRLLLEKKKRSDDLVRLMSTGTS